MVTNATDELYATMQHALLTSDQELARRAIHMREIELMQGRPAAKAPSVTPLRRLGLALVRLGERFAQQDTAARQV